MQIFKKLSELELLLENNECILKQCAECHKINENGVTIFNQALHQAMDARKIIKSIMAEAIDKILNDKID